MKYRHSWSAFLAWWLFQGYLPHNLHVRVVSLWRRRRWPTPCRDRGFLYYWLGAWR